MLLQIFDWFMNLGASLTQLITASGHWSYLILFLIIFAETGLVVLPFLPGDSLLFVAGSITVFSQLNVHLLVLILILAAMLGNITNYFIGRWFGHWLFRDPNSKIFRRSYLEKAHAFYEKHGAIAVIIARFVPFIRTCIPFVAGMAEMTYSRFIMFSLIGAIGWIAVLVYAGHFFGQAVSVEHNISWVILGIIVLSLLPMAIEIFRQYRKKRS